jgi:hypothetical protein
MSPFGIATIRPIPHSLEHFVALQKQARVCSGATDFLRPTLTPPLPSPPLACEDEAKASRKPDLLANREHSSRCFLPFKSQRSQFQGLLSPYDSGNSVAT